MSFTMTATKGYQYAQTAIIAYPFSLFAWAEHDSLATTGAVLSLQNPAAYGSFSAFLAGAVANDPLEMRRMPTNAGAGVDSTDTSNAYSINTPMACGMVCAGTTDARIFLNGTKTTDSTSVAFPTSAPTQVSTMLQENTSVTAAARVGRYQNLAAWNVALTDDEMVSLAKGFSPLLVRPQALTFYAPFIRDTLETLTKTTPSTFGTASVVADHMRVYGI